MFNLTNEKWFEITLNNNGARSMIIIKGIKIFIFIIYGNILK